MPVTALPTPPSRNDPVNFPTRADNFLGVLPTFALELNDLQVDVNAAESSAISAANTANAAANSATLAAGVSAWVSGTTYSIGQQVWSPTTFQTFRRRTAGAGTTDPASDATNWEPLSISSSAGITLNNTVSYKSRLSTGVVSDIVKISSSNVLEIGSSNTSLSMFTNGIPSFSIDVSGRVGIGTQSPSTNLDLVGISSAFKRIQNNASLFDMRITKARGTVTTPTTVLNGDGIGGITFAAHDGTAERPVGGFYFFADGTPATGTVPGFLEIAVTPPGTNATPLSRLSINSLGNIGVATNSPARRFHIVNTAPAGSTVSQSTGLMLSNSSSDGTLISPNTTAIQFADSSSTARGSIEFGVTGYLFSRITVNNVVVFHAESDGKIGFGTSSPTRSLHINALQPAILLSESDQTVDNKKWMTSVSASTYRLSLLSDNESAEAIAYEVTRSGNVVTGQNFAVNGAVALDIQSTGTVRYGGIEVGYRNVPRVTGGIEQGKCFATSSGVTLNTGPTAGATYSVYNDSASAITITQGVGLTLRLAGSTTTGNRTIGPRGMATIWYNSSTEAIITGAGVS